MCSKTPLGEEHTALLLLFHLFEDLIRSHIACQQLLNLGIEVSGSD